MVKSKSKFTVIFFLKVVVLLSLIFIFSYVNARRVYIKKQGEVLQKIKNKKRLRHAKQLKKIKEKTHDVKEGFDNLEDEVECSVEFSVAVFFIYDIIAFIFKAIWWVLSILAEPFGNLLKELLGDYYDPLMYPFILLGHLYKFAITVFFKMLKYPIQIISWTFDIIIRILFRILPRFLLDILSYIFAVPFLLFNPILDFIRPATKYIDVFCWKREKGLIQDLYDNLDYITEIVKTKFEEWNDAIISAVDEQKKKKKKKKKD